MPAYFRYGWQCLAAGPYPGNPAISDAFQPTLLSSAVSDQKLILIPSFAEETSYPPTPPPIKRKPPLRAATEGRPLMTRRDMRGFLSPADELTETWYDKNPCVQGYLARKKPPTPLWPPYDPRHRATVGS